MRFRSGDVRLFKGRGSIGVRGIRLKKDDQVITISVLKHIEADTEVKTMYLKAAHGMRGASIYELPSGLRLHRAVRIVS